MRETCVAGKERTHLRIELLSRLLGEDTSEFFPVRTDGDIRRQEVDVELVHPRFVGGFFRVGFGEDDLLRQIVPRLAVEHVAGHVVTRVTPDRLEIDQHRLVLTLALGEGGVETGGAFVRGISRRNGGKKGGGKQELHRGHPLWRYRRPLY